MPATLNNVITVSVMANQPYCALKIKLMIDFRSKLCFPTNTVSPPSGSHSLLPKQESGWAQQACKVSY